mgnify:FL=1
MKDVFSVSDGEKDRIRKLHEVEGEIKKISSALTEQSILNDETATNIISEGPFSGRGVHATLCCSAMMLGYWASTCPLPAVITASNGNRGAMYLTIGKMTINGNTPQPGQYFKAIESQGGSPTGNNPNGESSGLIYKVISTSAWNPFYSTVNFPSAGGCPSCPGISTWTCNPQYHMSSNYYTGGQGTCTELPTNCAIYATEQDCQNSGDPDCAGNTSFECQNGNCYQVQGVNGQYADLITCQQNCTVDKYKCTNGSCSQDPSGQYTSMSDCQQNCEQVTTYDCKSVGSQGIYNGQCVVINGPGGQYQTLATCQQNCKYEGKWTCKEYNDDPQGKVVAPGELTNIESRDLREQALPTSGWHCIKDPNGIHNTKQACETQCPPRDRKIDCINCEAGQMTQVTPPDTCPKGFDPVTSLTNGDCTECQGGQQCVGMGWGFGPGYFNSMALCQANCTGSNFACVNGNCQPDPNGPFTSSALCQQNCPGGGNTWDCTGSSPFGPPSACVQVNGSGGQFTTEEECLASPCACDDIITTWNLYLNNPNNPTGNWYGTPHDGPSNLNAIQNQLTNLQGSPNYPGYNLTQQHKVLCKEAAMQFWLGGPGNTQCCDDATYAANGGNGDPLGCVSQANFIPMMNNFMNNHAGWPNQGCDWLQTALQNAQTQLATGSNGGPYPNTSNAYCKLTGKINFLNNFITTAQSAYLTGTAVFTPGC